jgi:hypothetical protein
MPLAHTVEECRSRRAARAAGGERQRPYSVISATLNDGPRCAPIIRGRAAAPRVLGKPFKNRAKTSAAAQTRLAFKSREF